MPQVLSTKVEGKVEQLSDTNSNVLKAWDDMHILVSAIMLSWRINALCNPILHGSRWIQRVYTASPNAIFFFSPWAIS